MGDNHEPLDDELDTAQRHTANNAKRMLNAAADGIRHNDPNHTLAMIAATRRQLDTLEGLALLAQLAQIEARQQARTELRYAFAQLHPMAV
jgi:hypothetical protein